MKPKFIPPLEHGHPIPPALIPRPSRARKEDPLTAHFRTADHGDSVRIHYLTLDIVRHAAKKAGFTCRWRDDGHASDGARMRRVWLLRPEAKLPPLKLDPSHALKEALAGALEDLEHFGPSLPPSHVCGPEACCDGLCMDVASFNTRLAGYRALL